MMIYQHPHQKTELDNLTPIDLYQRLLMNEEGKMTTTFLRYLS